MPPRRPLKKPFALRAADVEARARHAELTGAPRLFLLYWADLDRGGWCRRRRSSADRIDGRYLEVHQRILTLFALQTPMAGDLRLLAALLHVIRHVERMGDQCVNMAKLVPLAGHEPPADEGMLRLIHGMGVQAGSQTVQARQSFERRDVGLARDLVRQDDEIDRLNREVVRLAIEIGDDPDRREWAMHMMLVARYLERIGDNAVDVGEQTAFVVTGLFREFEDASHPDLSGDGG